MVCNGNESFAGYGVCDRLAAGGLTGLWAPHGPAADSPGLENAYAAAALVAEGSGRAKERRYRFALDGRVGLRTNLSVASLQPLQTRGSPGQASLRQGGGGHGCVGVNLRITISCHGGKLLRIAV